MRGFARGLQELWRCPAAGHTPAPLPEHLAREAAHAASIMGTPVSESCPFACIERADPWVAELTGAVSLAVDWHVALPDTLGRDLTRADTLALQHLKQAQADAQRSDADIARREHEHAAKARRGAP